MVVKRLHRNEIVSDLETLLEQARRGDVVEILLVWKTVDKQTFTCASTTDNSHILAGMMLEGAIRRLLGGML